MGRKTYESMGRPLPNRQNIVVTRNFALALPGCTMARSLADALALCALPEPAFCIGGAEIYRQALPFAAEIQLTEIDAEVSGDTLLPAFSRADWREAQRDAAVDPASGLQYSFIHLLRIDPPPVPALPQTTGVDPA